jgi:hypothetical protein
MRRLITIATLGLTLSFSSLSFASDYMNLYTKPIARNEVKNEIKGGDVEKDFTSFYTSPKTSSPKISLTSGQKSDDQYVFAFGVRIAK